MAPYRYFHGEVEADNESELWLKFPNEVCRPYHHKFYPTKKQTPSGEIYIDECSKCMTTRIPSRMVYPIEKPKSHKINKSTRTKMSQL